MLSCQTVSTIRESANMKKTATTGGRTVGASEMAAILGISVNTFNVHKRNGLPSVARGMYDAEAVCRWAMSQPRRGKMWESASFYLSAITRGGGRPRKAQAVDKAADGGKNPLAVVELPKTRPPDGGQAEGERKLQFSVILDKFRKSVDYLADRFNDARLAGDYVAAAEILKTWGPTFDNLRKAEESIIELCRERETLLPRDDVREAFVALTANIRTRFMSLPGKLSRGLVNQKSANGIMAKLDTEIRGALEAVARDPFG